MFACLPFQQKLHNVHLYLRYRDDILVVYSRMPGERSIIQFGATLKSLASSTYVVECEQIAESAAFLDMYIYKSGSFMSTGALSFRPYIKETQQKVPLSYLSMHPMHIHSAWPLSEASRLFRRSSTWHIYVEARNQFVSKLEANYIHIDVIQKIKEWIPFNALPRVRKPCTWLVLPYSPVMTGFQQVVDQLLQRWIFANFDLPVRVSHCMGHTRSLKQFLEEF
jgi:hypothetical protein